MDFDAIAVFVKVVQAGSLSGAARLLGMPKTTVSAKLAALEKRLGVTLIQRTTRKLHITDAGRDYFAHCAAAVHEIEQAEAALHSSQATPSGLLRITAPVDLCHSVLPPILSAYLARHPETAVELLVSNRVADLIGEGIDLAIRAGELQDSTLVARRFFDIRSGLWASPAYLQAHGRPRHPKDLARHRVMALPGLKTIELTNGRASERLSPRGRIAADDLETVKALVAQGEGIGWLPHFLVQPDVAGGILEPVLPQWRLAKARAFYFVYPGRKYASPKLTAFIDLALAMVAPKK